MSPGYFAIVLILVNIPVYLFIGWIVFDDVRNASQNFLETVVEIVKAILIPRVVRMMLGDDSSEGSVFNIFIFLAGCVFITIGEFYLFGSYFIEIPAQ